MKASFRQRLLPLLVLLGFAALGVGPALASTTEPPQPVELRLDRVDADPDGTTRLSVTITGLPEGETVTPERVEVVENGRVVSDVTVVGRAVEETAAVTPAVVIAVDTSESTQGDAITAARAAGAELVRTLDDSGVAVGVVSFSRTIETLAPLGTPGETAASALLGVEAVGGTALYDGVSRAVRMLAQHDGPRDVVVFSDGGDTRSSSSLDDVRALLAETGVRVTSIVLRTDQLVEGPLLAMADVNGGRTIGVESAGDLTSAFEAIAADFTNRLTLVYTAAPSETRQPILNIVATYRSDAGVASDGVQVESPRLVAITPPVPVDVQQPLVGALTGATGVAVAAVGTGIAVLLLAFLILAGSGQRRRVSALQERLSAYADERAEHAARDRTSLTERASEAFDSIPRPTNLDSTIAARIEQADWPLRVSEFLLISLGTGVLGALVGGVVLGSGVVALAGLLFGMAAPWVYLTRAVSKRQEAFAEQLPTLLQVLAGALRAGHAFSTALDNAVDEIDEPAKSEIRRAAVEARLGRPLDRALEGVAGRMNSEDLHWVIGALEVQREVGGNLAEVLANVSATLRDRASIGRHVKALTAEGRLSAVFISAMPFVMFLFLFVTNPEYMAPLLERPLGRFMLASGLTLLVLGIVVLRRLVQPKY